jgi:hypothetical protein
LQEWDGRPMTPEAESGRQDRHGHAVTKFLCHTDSARSYSKAKTSLYLEEASWAHWSCIAASDASGGSSGNGRGIVL